jgi:hypothetical protein
VLREADGAVLRTWGDTELNTPHGLRAAPVNAHRSLLPPLLDRGAVGAGWTLSGATARAASGWPASAAAPALELADAGDSSGVFATVATVAGARHRPHRSSQTLETLIQGLGVDLLMEIPVELPPESGACV